MIRPTPCTRVLDEVPRVAIAGIVAVARTFEHRRAIQTIANRHPTDAQRRVEDTWHVAHHAWCTSFSSGDPEQP